MSAALVFLPIWSSITPPLSLGYLHAALKQNDIPVKSYDFSPKFRPIMLSSVGDVAGEEAIISHPDLIHGWIAKILETNPRVVGFSCVDSNFRVTGHACKLIKKINPGMTLVLGGARFTTEQRKHIDEALTFADYVVQGEGEEVFPAMVRNIVEDKSVKGMLGVWYRDENGVSQYGGDSQKVDLDSRAFPNLDDFDLEDYNCNRRLSIMFSRGCVLNCTFCTNKYNDKSQRTRSAQNVFEELKLHAKKYNIREYMFNDDSLISRVTFKPLEDYCDMVLAEGLVYPWSVYGTRVERLLTPEYVAKLRKSGLSEVRLGVESFASGVQRDMGKSSTYEIADRTVRMFLDAGVLVRTWIIYGYPSETDADFDATYNWLAQYGHLIHGLSVNCFNANERYLSMRPGKVEYFFDASWGWNSEAAPLHKRKERFLRLVQLLNDLKIRSGGKMELDVGDPYAVKYFKEWSPENYALVMERWAQEDERAARSLGRPQDASA